MGLKGDTGIDIETIVNDKVVIVGDHPNLNPSLYIEPTGRALNGYSVSEYAGCVQTKSAIPLNTPIDNAGDFHGGTCTFTVMNSLHFEVANGGISLETGGNVSISSWGGIVGITGSHQVGINSDLVLLNANNNILINGPSLYVDTEDTTFNNTAKFGANILARGAVGVNGELIANHITTQRQINFTEDSSLLYGYPKRNSKVKIRIKSNTPWKTRTPIAAGSNEITIEEAECEIIFEPEDKTPIIKIPSHDHVFEGPACTLTDGITDLFSKLSSSEGSSPVEANPALPMDMPIADLNAKLTKKIQDRASQID